jgi:hypothetical protein
VTRPSKEQVEAALAAADGSSYSRAFGGPSHFDILADEVRALREEYSNLLTSWAELKAHRDELSRQLVAANLALRECTHERVDPNRDPFGGF